MFVQADPRLRRRGSGSNTDPTSTADAVWEKRIIGDVQKVTESAQNELAEARERRERIQSMKERIAATHLKLPYLPPKQWLPGGIYHLYEAIRVSHSDVLRLYDQKIATFERAVQHSTALLKDADRLLKSNHADAAGIRSRKALDQYLSLDRQLDRQIRNSEAYLGGLWRLAHGIDSIHAEDPALERRARSELEHLEKRWKSLRHAGHGANEALQLLDNWRDPRRFVISAERAYDPKHLPEGITAEANFLIRIWPIGRTKAYPEIFLAPMALLRSRDSRFCGEGRDGCLHSFPFVPDGHRSLAREPLVGSSYAVLPLELDWGSHDTGWLTENRWADIAAHEVLGHGMGDIDEFHPLLHERAAAGMTTHDRLRRILDMYPYPMYIRSLLRSFDGDFFSVENKKTVLRPELLDLLPQEKSKVFLQMFSTLCAEWKRLGIYVRSDIDLRWNTFVSSRPLLENENFRAAVESYFVDRERQRALRQRGDDASHGKTIFLAEAVADELPEHRYATNRGRQLASEFFAALSNTQP